jgi:hypothetical protein
VGALHIRAGIVQRYNGSGWEYVPLAEKPLGYTVTTPGVWYFARSMTGAWQAEHHDMLEIRRMGHEEREIAKVLLRCALARLEEMED